MKWLQWIPMVATLALIYVLRWLHIGVTNFKVFVLTILVWTLLLILFYHRTRARKGRDRKAGEALEAGLSSDD
jgi:L-asparagine transporter-like permease